MRDHFIMFAAYNGWANRKLYETTAHLSDEDYRKDCAVAFTSMHGTLNHLLVADWIWMDRFQARADAPTQLNAILHVTLADLLAARRDMDDRIIDYANGLSEGDLASEFTYTPITIPEPVTQKLAPALAHFFNHQTHHRGQAHAMLTRLAGNAPSLDLIYYQRDVRLGTAV